MKREYSKPTIHVEEVSMDMPVATSCSQYVDLPDLKVQGWFAGGCMLNYNDDNSSSSNDTICYHSHSKMAFSS